MYCSIARMSRSFDALGHRLGATAGKELAVQVRRRQPKVIQVEHPRPRPRRQPQRSMLASRCPRLVHTWIRRETAAWRASAPVPGVVAAAPLAARSAIAAFTGAWARSPAAGPERGEIVAPLQVDARRIAQVLLVKSVEKIGVAAVEGCRFEHGGEGVGRR